MYMRLGFAFYFKKIRVVGLENIPKKKAILFVSNHQNALIDPLLIASLCPRELNFLTRAGVFGNSFIKALLSSINMLPIYRIGDGLTNLHKNEEIFQKCYKILGEKGTILIFPEGNHNIRRRIRALSKGFTRIVFGALERNPELEIIVLPIGINYSNAKKYASSVSIYFGEPISVNELKKKKKVNAASADLKIKVGEKIKKLVSHIENQDDYDDIIKSFREDDFLYPEKVNKKLSILKEFVPRPDEINNSFNFLTPIVKINSFLPLLIWKYVFPKIDEEEFIATFKFLIGITAFPFFYLLQSWLIHLLLGNNFAISYLLLSFLSFYLFTKSK